MNSPSDLLQGTASFGYWIRRHRQALDMTQAMLARQVGCATITIQKIEYEERRPSRQMAGRLADCLAIPENERATFIASLLGETLATPLSINARPLIQHAQPQVGAPQVPLTASVPTNLPHQLTPFVGREAELAHLDNLLNQEDARLITITGPGGMGKTRLSLAVAERHLADQRFAQGVYFVPLASLSDAQHIIIVLAAALSLSLHFGDNSRTPEQQLLDYVRTKSMLVIFDNFEHLLDGAELVAQILREASQVRVLATSREWLRLPGEHLFPVDGLNYGKAGHDGAAIGSDAVQLFVQSAKFILPQLAMNEEDLAQVTHICRLVGGMPLGIELAASWIALLSPAEITSEIQHGLDFLEVERRGSREEHQSMRAVFESSWQHLDQVHQEVFARLSIFRGGFTREASEEVAGASLRLLGTLAGKSLIQYDRERGRYMLHELLRQFGEEKLLATSQSANETYERLCAHYTTFLQQQECHLRGRQQLEAISAIEAELENIRTAWQWAVTHCQTESIDRSLEALSYFYSTKSWYQEGFAAFSQAADALHMDVPTGRDGLMLGRILARQGLMLASFDSAIVGATVREKARDLCQRSLHIFETLGARAESAVPLYWLGMLAHSSGDIGRAMQLYEEALAIFTDQHESWHIALTLHSLGSCYSSIGKYEQAIHYHREAIVTCDDTGDMRSLGVILYKLADTLRAAGEYQESKVVAEKALALSRATGARRNASHTLRILGELAWNVGDYAAAQHYAAASLALLQELGLTRLQDAPLVILGNAACDLGDFPQAKAHFHTVLRSHHQAGTLSTSRFVADAVVGLANLLAKEGQMAQAVELLNHVLHRPAVWQETKTQAAELLELVLHRLGASQDLEAQTVKLMAEMVPEAVDQIKPLPRSLNVVLAEVLRDEGLTF